MNASTSTARAMLTALVASGVREIVLCPGSRSSAVAYAARDAERAGLVRLHVRVDERSAAFLALGLAKRSRRPAAVVTTSGTAVANLHPAVLEAAHAQVPLVVISADRPASWRGTGANQTTIQPGMYANAVRAEIDLAPEDDWSVAVAACVATSVGSEPGPVQINAQFREPLVPDLADLPWQPVVQRPDGSVGLTGVALTSEPLAPTGNSVGGQRDWGTRPLVILGDVADLASAAAALRWADAAGVPVIAEPFGPHPRPAAVTHGVLALGDPNWLDANLPDEVIVIGRPTLSRPVTALVRRTDVRLRIVPAGSNWSVPERSDAEPVGFAELPQRWPATPGWTQRWLARGAAIDSGISAALANGQLVWPSGVVLARELATALPADAVCFVGSSNAVRDIDAAAGPVDQHLDIVASRGLAGIDGCLATAIGLALAEPDRPTYAVVGDLTFLHDANALAIGREEPRPDLTVIVPNDGGGGIFALLEPGAPERIQDFDRLFRTRTGTDLAALCAAHGVAHHSIEELADFRAAIVKPSKGIRVIEVPIDPSTHRPSHAALRALAASAGA